MIRFHKIFLLSLVLAGLLLINSLNVFSQGDYKCDESRTGDEPEACVKDEACDAGYSLDEDAFFNQPGGLGVCPYDYITDLCTSDETVDCVGGSACGAEGDSCSDGCCTGLSCDSDDDRCCPPNQVWFQGACTDTSCVGEGFDPDQVTDGCCSGFTECSYDGLCHASCIVCGDGVVEGNEECEPPDNSWNNCGSGPTDACSSTEDFSCQSDCTWGTPGACNSQGNSCGTCNTGTCSATGTCTGDGSICSPGSTQCSGSSVETCTASGCGWSTTTNCNNQDGWYDSGIRQWVSSGQCTEKEQKLEQFRDFSCGSGSCTYLVTSTQWTDTGNTRNMPDGTSCNDGVSCTSDTCLAGVCQGQSICSGTSTSCGCTSCQNCDLQDGGTIS